MQGTNPQQSFTIKGTAELLACSVPTIYRLIRDKILKTFRVGADQCVLGSELAEFKPCLFYVFPDIHQTPYTLYLGFKSGIFMVPEKIRLRPRFSMYVIWGRTKG